MLLTEFGYEAIQPAWLSSQLPLQSWRYVGIGADVQCFLIDRGPNNPSTAKLLRACLVTSPVQLCEDLRSVGQGDYRVYVFDFSDVRDSESRLVPLIALYSYVVAGSTWFSYMTDDGRIQPCVPSQPAPSVGVDWGVEWARLAPHEATQKRPIHNNPIIECEMTDVPVRTASAIGANLPRVDAA